MLDVIMIGLQALLAFVGIYQFGLSLAGIMKNRQQKKHAPTKTFAVLVAAHNEETVVGALVENLLALNYPREMFDIFVICDNCTDNTAGIVRGYEGVFACERTNKNLRGKGYAIEWMLKELWKQPKSYDAIVMFDADNLSDPEFLNEMNNDLCNGARVIQGYLDTKNPHDSWITSAYAVTYWYCNRLWQLSRRNLNMANFLGGTGMCFETALLKEMGWGATSLVEDLEFSARCISRGINPVFNYDAKVFDEKPLTFAASSRQRLRWMQGHFTVARKYFFPLLWASIKERNLAKFDMAIYSANVYTVLLTFVLTAVMWIDAAFFGGPNFVNMYQFLPKWTTFVVFAASALMFIVALMLEKVKSGKIYLSLITFPLYLISWYPITVYAFFTQNNKTWSHTQHTRVVRLEEVQNEQVSKA